VEEPAAKGAALAAPTELQSRHSRQAKSLQAETLPDISKNLQPWLEEAASPQIFHRRHDNVDQDVRAEAVATAPFIDGTETRKSRAKPLLAELELDTAIRLRWVMRDIKANRTAISPSNENDLATLVKLGLVEMREKLPGLTALGVLELD
jgi:hypothetical protein